MVRLNQSPCYDWPNVVALAQQQAPFLKGLMREHASLMEQILTIQHIQQADQLFDECLLNLRTQCAQAALVPVKAYLRQARAQIALLAALMDLAGVWPLERVTHQLSRFADQALACALDTVLQPVLAKLKRLDDTPITGAHDAGLVVFALGKLGGHELNYSSDVDLVCFYDEQIVTTRDGESPIDVFVRALQQFIALLQDRTAEGYCLRVDLRLRPDPNATPIALSMASAEGYYHSLALNWERAAWTRARVCAGDTQAGAAFLKRLAPWVWRRSFDYSAVRDLHSIKRQIEEHFGQEMLDIQQGYDVKRGIGGLREIEFMVQLHQLIAGGRTPSLRQANTLAGVQAIGAAGLEPPATIAKLTKAYCFWRQLEHRLQMLNDTQTHMLSADADTRRRVAKLMGFRQISTLEQRVARTSATVHALYRRFLGPVAEDSAEDMAGDAAQGIEQIKPHKDSVLYAQLSPHLSQEAMKMVEGWRRGRVQALRTPRARAALERLLPIIMQGLAQANDPATALRQFDDVLHRLPAGVQLLEVMEARPALLTLLLRVFALAPPLAKQLARTPALLDAILAQPLANKPPLFAPLQSALRARLAHAREVRGWNLEEQLTTIGLWLAEERFRLSVQLVERILTPHEALRAFADFADCAVHAVAQAAERTFIETHGQIAGSHLLVLALGSWGGSQLLPGSDLDMVFLFTGAQDSISDGARPLAGAVYFNRLAQRISGYLTATRPEGALYEIDTRLRPSGKQGLLAVSTESFISYQTQDAWVWEHQALTRARVVYANAHNTAQLSQKIAEVLQAPRDKQKICKEITQMRLEMDKHRPPLGPLDVKLGKGGLIDIEFLVQALQLMHAHEHPTLLTPILEQAIRALGTCGVLSPTQSLGLLRAQQSLLSLRLGLALCRDEPYAALDPDCALAQWLARLQGQAHWSNVLTKIEHARRQVRSLWHIVFQQTR
jgi:[glutamine synthetase] adenylyltransferase / [glutamine synthetase]-adenylyl-L-tyrosine phosphorylase